MLECKIVVEQRKNSPELDILFYRHRALHVVGEVN
jgi:hypothetical protein